MSMLGIVGGTGPESTIDYYRLLLARMRERGLDPPPSILIHSIDNARLLALAGAGDLDGLADLLVAGLAPLERAGATLAFFAANTSHLVFDRVAARTSLPLVSIVEATADAVRAAGNRRVGLLGTRATMEASFYPDALGARGIAFVAAAAADREYVHAKYVGELVPGRFLDETRAGVLAVIARLRAAGAEAVILGGTELPLLLRGAVAPLPLFDTARIHVDAIVERLRAEVAP